MTLSKTSPTPMCRRPELLALVEWTGSRQGNLNVIRHSTSVSARVDVAQATAALAQPLVAGVGPLLQELIFTANPRQSNHNLSIVLIYSL